MSTKYLLLLLTLLHCYSAGIIQPSTYNPVILSENSNSLVGHTLTITFKLPKNSTLPFGNYIGVDVSDAGEGFALVDPASYSCHLADLENNQIMVANGSDTFGQNFIFCKVVDTDKKKYLVGDKYYKLKITFTEDITVHDWGNVGIFTSLHNTNDRVIVDHNKYLTSMYTYTDPQKVQVMPLMLTSSATKVTAGSNTDVAATAGLVTYLRDTFYTTHNFMVNDMIYRDYYFCIRFNPTNVVQFKSVISRDISSTENLKKALQGSLGLEVLEPGLVRITGIAEDIAPGREFTLILNEWTATDKTIERKDVEFLIFYKNTNTFFSYDKAPGLISVRKVSLTDHKVASTEGHKFISSMLSWPVTVKVQPELDFDDGYIVVENVQTEYQKAFFSASTCDFSSNFAAYDYNTLPVCHSFSTSTRNGLFFKASIKKATPFSFTVWMHFSKCGASSNVISGSSPTEFKISVYDSIMNKSNAEAIPNESHLLADRKVSSDFTCVEAIVGGGATPSQRETVYGGTDLEQTNFSDVKLLAKEMNEIELYNIDSRVDPDVMIFDVRNVTARPAGYDIPATAAEKTASIKFGTSPRVYLTDNTTYTATSYVVLTGKSVKKEANYKAWPTIRIVESSGVAYHTNTYLRIDYQKKWFGAGKYTTDSTLAGLTPADLCYVSWNLTAAGTGTFLDFAYTTDQTGGADAYVTNLVPTNLNALPATTNATTLDAAQTSYNFLFQGTNSNIAEVSLPNNEQAGATTYYFKSKTIYGANATTLSFPSTNSGESTAAKDVIGLFTNCLTYATTLNNMKAPMFEYFEVLVTMRKVDLMEKPIRLYRFLSFFSMGNVFRAASSSTYNVLKAPTTYIAVQNASLGLSSVCITKIDPLAFSTGTLTKNTTVAVFLFNIRLLEGDFTSYDVQYPIPNLSTGVKAYGYSTYPPFHEEDIRVQSQEYNRENSIFLDAVAVTMNFTDHQVLASRVVIHNLTETKATDIEGSASAVLIPHYCLEGFPSKNVYPVVSTSHFHSTNMNDIVKEEAIFPVGEPFSMIIDATIDIHQITDYKDNYAFAKGYLGTNEINFKTKEAILLTGHAQKTFDFKSIAMLFTDKFTLGTGGPTLSTMFATQNTAGISTTPFYFAGNRFSSLYLAESTATTVVDFEFSPVTGIDLSVSNITTPSFDSLLSSNMLNLHDQYVINVSSQCTNTGNAKSFCLYTNLAFSNNKSYALLSLEQSDSDWAVTFSSFDDHFYAKMSRINFNFTGVKLNNAMQLAFTLPESTYAQQSSCGIFGDTRFYHSACSHTVDSVNDKREIKCPVSTSINSPSTLHKICCYNISLVSTAGSDNLAIEAIKAEFTSPTALSAVSSFFSYTVSDVTAAYSVKDLTIVSEPKPQFMSVSFSYDKTLGSLGMATLEVNVKKQLSPSSQINIFGDFSAMSPFAENPNCFVTVSSDFETRNWIGGDEILRGCSVTNFGATDSSITILTKDDVLGCIPEYESKLFIKLWPVKVENIGSKTYTASLGVNGSSFATGDSVSPSVTVNTPSAPVFSIDSSNEDPQLCNLTGIFPRAVGAKGTFTFRIDMSKAKANFEGKKKFPNELTVILPFEVFGGLEPKYFCEISLENYVSTCSGSEEGFLTIALDKDLTASTLVFYLMVYNVNVPKFDSIYFSCLLSRVDSSGARIGTAIGRGTSKVDTLVEPKNRLIFFPFDYEYDKNPRQMNTLSFKFGLDKAGLDVLHSYQIDDTPQIVFQFPESYPISLYQPEITVVLSQQVQQLDKSTYTLSSEEVKAEHTGVHKSNIVAIPLNKDTNKTYFTLYSNVEIFKVDFTNLPFPLDNTTDSGKIDIFFTNSKGDFLMRTYPGTTNMYHNVTLDSSFKGPLNFTRGFPFTFDQKNWVVDFKNAENGEEINKIQLKVGFYTPIVAEVRNFSGLKSLNSAVVLKVHSSLSLKIRDEAKVENEHNYVKLYLNKDKTTFYIGVNCSTPLGRHLLDVMLIESPEVGKVLTVAKIETELVYTTKNIECAIPANIPKDFKASFTCDIPEVVDSFKLEFTRETAQKSAGEVTCDNAAVKSSCTFQTKFEADKATTDVIRFSATAENSCLRFEDGSVAGTYDFNMIDTNYTEIYEEDLTFLKFETRETKETLSPSQMELVYVSPPHFELYCAFYCAGKKEPVDEDLITQQPISEADTIKQFTTDQAEKSILFSNLEKDKEYHLKCSLISTNVSGEKFYIVKKVTELRKGNGNVTQFKLPLSSFTECAEYRFSSEPSSAVKQNIINICQDKFTSSSGITKGCKICSDLEKNMFSPGFKYNQSKCSESRLLEEKIYTGTDHHLFYVCVSEQSICDTELTEEELETAMGGFFELTKSKTAMQENLYEFSNTAASKVPLDRAIRFKERKLTGIAACSEEKTVDCLKIEKATAGWKGEFEVIVTADIYISCTYAIAETGIEFTKEDLTKCTSHHCGKFKTSNGMFTKISHTGLTAFKKEENGEYTNRKMYCLCESMTVVNPQFKYEEMFVLTDLTITPLQKNCALPDKDIYKDQDDGCTCLNKEGISISMGTGEDCGVTALLLSAALLFFFIL